MQIRTNNNANLATPFLLKLLQANGRAEAGRPSTDDTDVDLVTGAFDIVWVEKF